MENQYISDAANEAYKESVKLIKSRKGGLAIFSYFTKAHPFSNQNADLSLVVLNLIHFNYRARSIAILKWFGNMVGCSLISLVTHQNFWVLMGISLSYLLAPWLKSCADKLKAA